jgi:hypothetical protein
MIRSKTEAFADNLRGSAHSSIGNWAFRAALQLPRLAGAGNTAIASSFPKARLMEDQAMEVGHDHPISSK